MVMRSHHMTDWIPDALYLQILFRHDIGKKCNLKNPTTFNEKLQWLKLHDRNPAYTTMVDKYEAKSYVAKMIGDEYIIPTLGVWERFEDIDFDKLPEQFVLKCTHDSGGLVICRDKSKLDMKAAKQKIEHSLKNNYYYSHREWPYKNVKPRIIAEQYMEDASGGLQDYKLMMFNGEHKCTFTCTQRYEKEGLKVTFFDTDWKVMPFERHYPRSQERIDKPASYEKMVELATKLSKNIPFVRCDFYEIHGKPYFGELTFYPGSGMEEFNPEEYDKKLGDWITLPKTCGGGYLLNNDDCCLWLHEHTEESKVNDLKDYKFYCFEGEPLYCQVISNRSTNETIDFYDMDWIHQEFTGLGIPHHPFAEEGCPRPYTFEDMKKFAKLLAKGIHFVRIDFYEVNDKLYFGEITFYPASGFGFFKPEKWNKELGNKICLP